MSTEWPRRKLGVEASARDSAQPKQEFPVLAGALAGPDDPVAEANDQAA